MNLSASTSPRYSWSLVQAIEAAQSLDPTMVKNSWEKMASIQVPDIDGRPCRAAGRGGLGAVMGSKGLKALVVDQRGKSADTLADPTAFKEAAKDFDKGLLVNRIPLFPREGGSCSLSVY